MNSAFLGDALFVVIALSWTVYLVQEIFITGSSALNLALAKDEGERKQIQVASGLHWDGIEVWLIAAIVLTFGAFPLAFATSFTVLYVVFFLLLYALITRGVVIETLYKLDNPKWIRANAIAWSVSSGLIVFLLGVYVTSLFYGLPIEADHSASGSVFALFNVTTIGGGLLFLSLALASGAAWIALTTEGRIADSSTALIKKYGIFLMPPVFLLLVFMGFNVLDNSIFIGALFTAAPILFVLPALTFVASLGVLYFGLKQQADRLFLFALLTMALFLVTGFVGTYPIVLPSRVDPAFGITIADAMTQVASARIIFIAVCFFYPLILFYQGWKYKRFAQKVKPHDA